MTWGEFKAAVEINGVYDDTVIRWIDFFPDMKKRTPVVEHEPLPYSRVIIE